MGEIVSVRQLFSQGFRGGEILKGAECEVFQQRMQDLLGDKETVGISIGGLTGGLVNHGAGVGEIVVYGPGDTRLGGSFCLTDGITAGKILLEGFCDGLDKFFQEGGTAGSVLKTGMVFRVDDLVGQLHTLEPVMFVDQGLLAINRMAPIIGIERRNWGK